MQVFTGPYLADSIPPPATCLHLLSSTLTISMISNTRQTWATQLPKDMYLLLKALYG